MELVIVAAWLAFAVPAVSAFAADVTTAKLAAGAAPVLLAQAAVTTDNPGTTPVAPAPAPGRVGCTIAESRGRCTDRGRCGRCR